VYERLRQVPLFAELSDGDLAELHDACEQVHLAPGEALFAEGTSGDIAYVITEGDLEIIKGSSANEVLLAVRTPGEIIGEMALLEDSPRMASVRARTDATLLAIPKPTFHDLLGSAPAEAMLHTTLGRLRDTETQLRQSERMAQLGTLTAGVAHELNNPAAAVKRAAEQLGAEIATYGSAQAAYRALALDEATRAAADAFINRSRDATSVAEDQDPLERSDRETALEGWLDEHGIAEAWELAPDLVELSADVTTLESLGMADDELRTVLQAAVTAHRANSLVVQIERGSSRLSEIVKVLKSYSYLDQAPIQHIDVASGIDDTLLLLRSNLKDVRVVRDYADDLPTVEAYGSELNQVWTNLIDNAAYALHDANTDDPTVTIRVRPREDKVVVEIEDNGPGIPPEIQDRIFDTFFTTKPPGQGTGLGLDISHKIVLRHQGELTLASEPGRTTFRVALPLTRP
jgi:signal transduction histidine kinase